MSYYHQPPEQWSHTEPLQPQPPYQGIEVVSSSDPELRDDPQEILKFPHQRLPHYNGIEVMASTEPEVFPREDPQDHYESPKQKDHGPPGYTVDAGYSDNAARPPLWKRRKVILLAVALLLLIVGLSVGLGVGLGTRHSNDSGNTDQADGNDPNVSPPKCAGDICSKLVSASIHNSTLHIFARTAQGTIAVRTYNGSFWEDWQDLGETTGNLISQPSSSAWGIPGDYPRLDVFVVGTDDHSVYNRWYTDIEGWMPKNNWLRMGANAHSQIALCRGKPNRLDVWMTDADSDITHTWWIQNKDDEDNTHNGTTISSAHGRWRDNVDGWQVQPFRARTAPALVCRDSSVYHDMFTYEQGKKQVTHAAWSSADGWYYENFQSDTEGGFVGEPTAFSSIDDPERWDFFGVQANREVLHISQSDGYTLSTHNLGGNVLSVPAVASLEKGVLDVVALGINGTLQHTHYDGSAWSAKWEDLDIRAYSAPSISVLDQQVVITAVSHNGSLLAWYRNNSTSASWKDSLKSEKPLGGDLTLEYFI